MNEQDLKIQKLTQDVAKWKNRAMEAAERACSECEEYMSREKEGCKKCRMTKIKEEAAKE